MAKDKNIGGARKGAGRPKGVPNRRTKHLAEKFQTDKKCPAEALARIAQQAELDGDTRLAVDAWKALLPYVHAKPKAIESDPEAVLQMMREITEMGVQVSHNSNSKSSSDQGERLERAFKRSEELKRYEKELQEEELQKQKRHNQKVWDRKIAELDRKIANVK